MEYNEVGKIAQTHGLKGEVKVKTNSSIIDKRFKEGATLYIKSNDSYKPLTVKSHRSMLNYELVSFVGLEDINDVMPYLGKTLYGERDKNLLDEGKHFYTDIISMKVIQDGIEKGEVIKIVEYPQCDYLIVKTPLNKEKMIPFLDEFVEEINEEEKRIYITHMEGLLWLDLIV